MKNLQVIFQPSGSPGHVAKGKTVFEGSQGLSVELEFICGREKVYENCKKKRNLGSPISCGLARPRSLVGEKPTQVAVSHGPGIQPCRCSGNRMLDA
jgi:hypothetical protein